MPETFVSPGPLFFVIGAVMAVSIILIPFQTFVLNIGIWINARKKMAAVKAEADERFRRFIGAEAEHIDVAAGSFGAHVRQISGTGIAYVKGRLYVMDEGVAAEIPWPQIRSWTWNIVGWNSQEGPSAHARDDTPMVMIHDNARGRITAHRESGFTITTRDIQKSTWRFNTIDEKLCTKWMEVLHQMDEGALARR